jgi:alkanesulfonate monooxygenase SsuD/methylene tetrahydromethanopterin reductase-like flavin-dependent oxidoreductase (luciferase family)
VHEDGDRSFALQSIDRQIRHIAAVGEIGQRAHALISGHPVACAERLDWFFAWRHGGAIVHRPPPADPNGAAVDEFLDRDAFDLIEILSTAVSIVF